MNPNVIYLTDTVSEVIPFDKSDERIHGYISIDYLITLLIKTQVVDDDRLARGYNSALSDVIDLLDKEGQK